MDKPHLELLDKWTYKPANGDFILSSFPVDRRRRATAVKHGEGEDEIRWALRDPARIPPCFLSYCPAAGLA